MAILKFSRSTTETLLAILLTSAAIKFNHFEAIKGASEKGEIPMASVQIISKSSSFSIANEKEEKRC